MFRKTVSSILLLLLAISVLALALRIQLAMADGTIYMSVSALTVIVLMTGFGGI